MKNDVKFQVFTGGISNHLYGYYEAGRFHEDVVLFRIDGEGKDLMLDTERERENMQVNLSGIDLYKNRNFTFFAKKKETFGTRKHDNIQVICTYDKTE